MATVKLLKNAFTSGELSPLLHYRSDLEQYGKGARTLENVRVLPYGGVERRRGFEHKESLALPFLEDQIYTFEWKFNATVGYVLVFRCRQVSPGSPGIFDTDIRIYDSTGTLVDTLNGPDWAQGGTVGGAVTGAYELLRLVQINDVGWIFHPDLPPYKIQRNSATDWSIALMPYTYPPLLDENISAVTLTADATTGTGVEITASAPTFNAGHIGGYFEISHRAQGTSASLDISGTSGTVTSSAVSVIGDWQVTTSQLWYGTLELQRSLDNGGTWETIREWKSESTRNISASGTELERSQLRLNYTATGDPYGGTVWTGTPTANYVHAKATLESAEAYWRGLVLVTAFTDTTHVDVTVVEALYSTDPTAVWAEGAWSTYRGFPRAGAFFEQRLFFAGTTSRPATVWGSVTGDFENFRYGDTDTDAVSYTLATTERHIIMWMVAHNRLMIGTTIGEFTLASGSSDEPLTPTNVSVRPQSNYGSAPVIPKLVNDAVLFMQRQGLRLRELAYSLERDTWVAPDITILSEHITESGIKQIAVSMMPEPTVWLVRNDGVLVCLTYNREQNVIAATRWTGRGNFHAIAITPGEKEDGVFVIRKISDSNYYLEKLYTPDDFPAVTLDNAFYVDSGKRYTSHGSAVVTGLAHLEALSVQVLYDRKVTTATVALGQITLPAVADTVVVGVGFDSTVLAMPVALSLQDGSSIGKPFAIQQAHLLLQDANSLKIGRTEGAMDEIEFRTTLSPMDEVPALFTGIKTWKATPGHDKTGDVFIKCTQPLPLKLLGVTICADPGGQ